MKDIAITAEDVGGGWWNNNIGSTEKPFNGIFDGNGFTISGFVGGNEQRGRALFGAIGTNGVVKNLTIEFGSRGRLLGGNSAGLAAENRGTVENVVIKESLLQLNDGVYIAGIVFNNYGTIKNCIMSARIASNYGNTPCTIGGIAWNNVDGKIVNCFVDKKVTGITQALGAADEELDANCKTTDDLKNADLYADFDTDIWNITGDAVPTLKNGCTKMPEPVVTE